MYDETKSIFSVTNACFHLLQNFFDFLSLVTKCNNVKYAKP